MTHSLPSFTRFLVRAVSLLMLLLGASLLTQGQTIRYVKPTATGNSDGSRWANASGNLQTMITASAANDQVWVAAGTYKPTTGTDRTISFAMKNGVAIYGGFVGNETELSARPAVNPITGPGGASQPSSTTLSGDIGVVGSNADNSYHVIYNLTVLTTTAVLDGFVITGGKADGTNLPGNSGGGMYNNGVGSGKDCSPLIRNCSFQNNSAKEGGAALFNDGSFSGRSKPTLSNCIFQNNSAFYGGAIFNKGESDGSNTGADSSPVLANCSFQSNSATAGGAMVNDAQSSGRSNPTLTNCSFQDNSATDKGGAIFNNGIYSGTSNPTLTNCSFQRNGATVGGAMYNDAYSGTSSPTLTNCSFQGNTATNGGAMYSKAIVGTPTSISTLTNCVVFGNGGGNTFAKEGASSFVATYNLFENTVAGYSGSNNLTTTVSPFVSLTDARLNACSPAINAGNNAAYTTANGPTTDLAGNARVFPSGGIIDMGAYEYQAAPTVITLSAPGVSTATVGVAFSQPFTAAGGTGPYTYSVASGSLPTGLSLATTGVLSGTPTQSGSFTITVRATDANGCVGVGATYSLTVNAAPVATANDNQTATVGVAFSYTVNAFTDAESPNSLAYSASISPLRGLSFDPLTRVVSGSPTSPGASTVTVTATDGGGLSANTDFSITTRCPDLTASIQPSTATLSCANPTVSLTASGGESYRWEDNSTSAIRSVSTGGTYSVTVTAVGGCTASAQITVTGNATAGLMTYYADADGDGFGNPGSTTTLCSSTPPAGYVTTSTDCDDTRKLYADGDGDGFGAGAAVACGVATNTDCNDGARGVNPGAVEVCDGQDNDCDGAVDEGVKLTFYADGDGDGFGKATQTTQACSVPAGYVTNATDCDDTQRLYADGDGDGFGAGPAVACGIATNTDCDDKNAAINPTVITGTPTVSGVPVCAGDPVMVKFSAACPGLFTLQLSSASGSFTSPTPLGAWSPGSSVPIPATVPAGSGYRIRVVTPGGGPVSNPSAAFRVRACGTTRLAADRSAEAGSGLQVQVSPNPTEGRLRITISGAADQALTVELFSGSGQVLRQQGIEQAGAQESLSWDISRHPAGLYLLRVSSEREAKTIKVVR